MQVVLATGESNLVYLDIAEGRIQHETRVQLSAEVSCVDISPLGGDGDASRLAAVGTWDMQVLCARSDYRGSCFCGLELPVPTLPVGVLSAPSALPLPGAHVLEMCKQHYKQMG